MAFIVCRAASCYLLADILKIFVFDKNFLISILSSFAIPNMSLSMILSSSGIFSDSYSFPAPTKCSISCLRFFTEEGTCSVLVSPMSWKAWMM
mmetsp:Transcript_9073/g.6833  ORF Transcript_9073/g.6833 Transcript_9073/m.6833 type:complete len:93 (-) Transcript_9073:774-1052(-)